jgi:ATP-binding cassette subfamily C protein CydC
MADSLAYGRMPDQLATLDDLNGQVVARERHFARWDGLQQGLITLLVNGTALAVLAVAISRVEGIFLATITLAIVAAFEPLMPLGSVAARIGSDATAARRLFEIVDAAPATVDPPAPLPVPATHTLVFDDVSFRYSADDPPALDHFSLEIEPGERVAIIGPSGSGKSTLVNLLLRFWDTQEGHITLGGQDLRSLAQADVRQVFGVMTQRTHLFNTTILENIRIGRSSAGDDVVIEAAQKAQLHDFVQALPEKYDTLVGEAGARLSGGEAQRIALARVLLKDAPIYLLDEATANLDVMTEKALLQTLLEVTAGKTLILLTHRRVFLDRMDRVITLADGKVIGRFLARG